jgi:hypothetical protein
MAVGKGAVHGHTITNPAYRAVPTNGAAVDTAGLTFAGGARAFAHPAHGGTCKKAPANAGAFSSGTAGPGRHRYDFFGHGTP